MPPASDRQSEMSPPSCNMTAARQPCVTVQRRWRVWSESNTGCPCKQLHGTAVCLHTDCWQTHMVSFSIGRSTILTRRLSNTTEWTHPGINIRWWRRPDVNPTWSGRVPVVYRLIANYSGGITAAAMTKNSTAIAVPPASPWPASRIGESSDPSPAHRCTQKNFSAY